MRIFMVALAALFALDGCGGSGPPDSARSLAESVGCNSISPVADVDATTFDGAVTCHLRGHDLRIDWFRSRQAMADFQEMEDNLGVSNPGLRYGDQWAVECVDDEAGCDAFLDAAGYAR